MMLLSNMGLRKMDLEQIMQDFNDGKMISKCTWILVLQAVEDMENTLATIAKHTDPMGVSASNCLGRVAAL